jgi:hypothetical protein
MRLFALLLLASLAARAQVQDEDIVFQQEAAKFKVAVLGIKSGGLPETVTAPLGLISLTDDLRNEAPRLIPGLGVMTKESMQAIIDSSGQDASKCEGLCAVDLGKMVAADYVTDGTLQREGSGFVIGFSLYEVGTGVLLSGSKAHGADAAQLADAIRNAAREMFGKLKSRINIRVATVRMEMKRKEEADAAARQKAKDDRELALTREANAKADAERREARDTIDSQSRKTVMRWVGWGLTGAAVVSGLAAGASAIDGKSRESKIKEGVAVLSDLTADDAAIKSDNTKIMVFSIAGGALLTGGILLLLTQHPLDDDEVAKLQRQLSLNVTSNGLLVAGRF